MGKGCALSDCNTGQGCSQNSSKAEGQGATQTGQEAQMEFLSHPKLCPEYKTIPKSKRKPIPNSKPISCLSAHWMSPELSSHTNTNMSSQSKEPKVKETSTEDFGPDPLKIFTPSLLSKTFGSCFL